MPFIEHDEDNHGQAPEVCTHLSRPYDTLSGIMAYEEGTLDEDETIELFQELVNSGLAWQLQGHYGRMAMHLINSGHVRRAA